jgi:hypothetical protein
MVFTETSTTSWFGRLKNALIGTVIGLILFIAGFPILWWNEGRAKRQGDAIAEVAANVVSVPSDAVNPANNGKPVFTFGRATTDETLADPTFPVSAVALQLVRDVEMYQWKENTKTESRDKLGGGTERITTYSYEKVWSSTHYDSSGFKEEGHRNPPAFPLESWSDRAEAAHLGAFAMSGAVIAQMTRTEPVSLDQASYDAMPFEARSQYKLNSGGLYMGANPAAPTVGDVRIAWRAVSPADVSVLGLQSGGVLDTYVAKSGGTFLELQYGQASPEGLVAAAQSKEKFLRWALRVAGFLAMFIGLRMMFGIVSAVAYVVPFLGRIADFGLGVVAFLIALPCTLMTIAVAWIAVRPLIGIPLALVAVGAIVFLVMGLAKAKPKPAAA